MVFGESCDGENQLRQLIFVQIDLSAETSPCYFADHGDIAESRK